MSTKNLYLNKIQLKAETERCLQCPSVPCSKACPVGCNPMEFIACTKSGEWEKAVKSIITVNPMGQTCGLICPDKFCMKACTRGNIDFPINIPKIQATILENHYPETKRIIPEKNNDIKIAVIGAGPAGIAASRELASHGYHVSIFESSDKVGGALNMIPEDRLPHSVIERDCMHALDSDLINLRLNSAIPSAQSLLKEKGYAKIIIATGEPNVSLLNIEGCELSVNHIEYLYNSENYRASGKVAVIGGGNVAIDCAFTAVKNGAKQVEMIVRRRLSDMRISKHEYLELINKKINVLTLSSPQKIVKNNDKLTLYVCRNNLIDGKAQMIENSTAALTDFDLVITAVGSRADAKENDNPDIIYAGDCLNGGSTLVEALASGKKAASIIEEYFKK